MWIIIFQILFLLLIYFFRESKIQDFFIFWHQGFNLVLTFCAFVYSLYVLKFKSDFLKSRDLDGYKLLSLMVQSYTNKRNKIYDWINNIYVSGYIGFIFYFKCEDIFFYTALILTTTRVFYYFSKGTTIDLFERCEVEK